MARSNDLKQNRLVSHAPRVIGPGHTSERAPRPQTATGKLMFNIVHHVLSLNTFDSTSAIDLQCLQMSSQLIGVVLTHSFLPRDQSKVMFYFFSIEMWPAYL